MKKREKRKIKVTLTEGPVDESPPDLLVEARARAIVTSCDMLRDSLDSVGPSAMLYIVELGEAIADDLAIDLARQWTDAPIGVLLRLVEELRNFAQHPIAVQPLTREQSGAYTAILARAYQGAHILLAPAPEEVSP
jgi:hypothetical protein